MIQSTYSIGGLFGALIYGFLVNKIGRKRSIQTIAVPQIISFVLVGFADSATMILVSRVFGGFSSGALFVTIPLFVSEISEDS